MSGRFTSEVDEATVILRGNFNPAIFQPAWFKACQIISGPEADEAEVKVIHPAIAEFSTAWLQLSVTKDRFAAHTTNPAHFEELRDLTVSVFHLLEHTPTSAMGLNRDMHFRIETEERWHALGDALAPKTIWSQRLGGIGKRDKPGLRSMTIEGRQPGEEKCVTNVTVEPSVKVHPGVYVACNRHYKIEAFENSVKALLAELAKSWIDSLDYAAHIAETILEHA